MILNTIFTGQAYDNNNALIVFDKEVKGKNDNMSSRSFDIKILCLSDHYDESMREATTCQNGV